MSEAYDELRGILREVATLGSVNALLGWDQETMMPQKAGPARAEALATVARLAHESFTSPRVGELLSACEADPELTLEETAAANLREMRRDYDRARKLPPELVAEINEVSSKALEAWKVARADNDFHAFRPWLERQLALSRRKAECYGAPSGGEAYDALLDDYEPGMSAAEVERIFHPLRDELTPLIAEIAASGQAPDDAEQRLVFPIEAQRALNARVLAHLGFDLGGGRLDVSTHPFSTGISAGDTRITTRYRETHFADALSSTMHEAGHGLYEQGLPRSEYPGQPLGQSLGLGIHESQSRLWENHVGRSRAFWDWVYPLALETLGDGLRSVSAEELYRAANLVRPNLIRVESDEATYNLHIMIRFDLERAMLRDDLAVADLPAAWNDRIRSDLGLEVPDDAQGCLQDIHWSMGAIGYFPTYTLGTLYAAQLWEAVERAMPDVDEAIGRGDFAPLLDWLRASIHRHGRRYPAATLCRDLTGSTLRHQPLIDHLRNKLGPLYGF